MRAAPAPPPDADDATLRRALATWPRAVVEDRVWLAGGNRGLLARLAAMPVPEFPLLGRDLRRAGVPAGPELGRLLADLRAWWLAGGCTGDVRAELARRLRAG